MNFRGSSGKNSMRVGPWGGLGGDPWDDGINSGVRQIIISHGAAIYSIQFEYDLRGSLVWSEKHGTSGGSSKTDQVKLNYPEEVLTSISGCYGALGASVVIRSLTFESNCSKYGPFGTEQGTSFSLPVFTGKIVGFHGRSGTCLHSIGCHLNKENTTKLSKNAPTIIRSYDRNGHRYADSSAGYEYDRVLAVKDRGDNYNVLTSSLSKEQYPNPSKMSKMAPTPSLYSDNGTMNISTPDFRGSSGKNPMTVGPWGGLRGDPWDDGVKSGVRQIIISHGAAIDSIQFEYDLRGSLVWSDKHGTSGGSSTTDQVKLNYPEEVLTSISGCYGALGASVVIRSLTFESNCSKYGPFGTEQGTSFSLPVFTGKIVGFHGRSGTCLHSIGCHLNKENTTKLSKNAPTIIRSYDRNGHRYADSSAGYEYDRVLAVKDRGDNYNVLTSSLSKEQYPNPSKMSKMAPTPSLYSDNGTMNISTPDFRGSSGKNPMTVGPWGGLGGDPWDDGVKSGVRQIIISHGAAIDSIQFEYDLRGSLVWSDKHGTSGGSSTTDQVKLNYPEEVLTSISGCYGALGASVVIRSLTFESNCSKYGPFGTEQGTSFSLPVFTGKIVGFHGRSGTCLHSIGCHLNKENTTKLSKNAPTIIRSYDRNGHRYADSSAGYDIILAVKDRGDNYNVLASSVPKEQYPNNPSKMSKMVSIPSFHSDNGTMTISTPVRFGPWWKQWYHI